MITNVENMTVGEVLQELRRDHEKLPIDDEWCQAAAKIIERVVDALREACDIADENNSSNASSDDRRAAFERIADLRKLAR